MSLKTCQVLIVVLIIIYVGTPFVMHQMQKEDPYITMGLGLLHANGTILQHNKALEKINKTIAGEDFVSVIQYVASYTQTMAKVQGACIEPANEKALTTVNYSKLGSAIGLVILAILLVILGQAMWYTCVCACGALGCVSFFLIGVTYVLVCVVLAIGWHEMDKLECLELVPWIETTLVNSAVSVVAITHPTNVLIVRHLTVANTTSLNAYLPTIFSGFNPNAHCNFFGLATASVSSAKSSQIVAEWVGNVKSRGLDLGYTPATKSFYNYAFSKSGTEVNEFCEEMLAKLSDFFGYVAVTMGALSFIVFLISCFCGCACVQARTLKNLPVRDLKGNHVYSTDNQFNNVAGNAQFDETKFGTRSRGEDEREALISPAAEKRNQEPCCQRWGISPCSRSAKPTK